MNPVRRLLIGFAAVAAAAVGLVAAPSPASASTADCFYGVGIYETHLGIPRKVLLSGPVGPGQELPAQEVVVNGNIDVAGNTSCSKASVQFRLQTKVCGTFGCTWHTKAKSDTVRLPVDGRVPAELRMPGRPGTNSYRLQAAVTHQELTAEDSAGRWYPMLVTVTNTYEGQSDKISF